MTRAARFDGEALYAALDAQRTARGVSWQQLARKIGVSVSTMAGTKSGAAIETDGMLAMVAWLRRSPESLNRTAASVTRRTLPERAGR